MTTVETTTKRVDALEARVSDTENDLNVHKILNHLAAPPATDEEADAEPNQR